MESLAHRFLSAAVKVHSDVFLERRFSEYDTGTVVLGIWAI